MKTLTARVNRGRIVVEEPTRLPEGTVLNLTIADAGDDLSDEERAALHAALAASWSSAQAGHTRPGSELIARLAADK